MFNASILINFTYLIIYLVNVAVFTIFVSKRISSAQNSNKISTHKWATSDKFLLMLLVVVLAGLPPFSLFFFKVFIVLNAKNTTISVLLMCLVNVFVLYYYINFTTLALWGSAHTFNNNKATSFVNCFKHIKAQHFNTVVYIFFCSNCYFILTWEFLISFMHSI